MSRETNPVVSVGELPAEVDYVVVGAGLAGCVVAGRLAEGSDATVLVLEAGPWSEDPRISQPNAWPGLLEGELDWCYRTEPQRHLDNRELAWPRGRMVGGSAALNALVWIRGAASDFDAWTRWGGPEWGSAPVLSWLDRIEAGPGVSVSPQFQPHPFALAFVEAAQKYGLPANPDFNGAAGMEGIGLYRTTRKGQARHHTAEGYLRPALSRPGLTVAPNSPVSAVRVENGRAVGVRVLRGGATVDVRVRREVVLTAGTVATPQLLLLSGIGPADELRQHGVDVTLDLPGVGRNLHDHIQVSAAYGTTEHHPVATASNLGEAGGFVATRPGLPAPDVQLSFAPMENVNHAEAIGSGFTIAPAVTRPLSRGTLTLRSADPTAPPRIDPNYLAEQADVDTLVEGVRIARGIAATSPLADLRADGFNPANPGAEPTRRELEAFVRARAETQFHPVGTCRFGTDPDAVVDPRLRLHGVAGLRVADASAIPLMITGNIQAGVIVVAERAAEFILQDADREGTG